MFLNAVKKFFFYLNQIILVNKAKYNSGNNSDIIIFQVVKFVVWQQVTIINVCRLRAGGDRNICSVLN